MKRERRKRRYRAECPAEILVEGLAATPATALDLSEGGAFLETGAALPLQLSVKVVLSPPGRAPMTVIGHVLRVGYTHRTIKHDELDHLVVRVAGLAVKFEPLEGQPARDLDAYLKTLPEL